MSTGFQINNLCLANQSTSILQKCNFKPYFERFSLYDFLQDQITNDVSWDFFSTNIPFFECSEPVIERIYYFRWWTFRQHIKIANQTTRQPFHVITEFTPDVPWSGYYNTIPCAAGHHIREGRWLHNSTYIEDYISFWMQDGNPRTYSFWYANSVLNFLYVTAKFDLITSYYPGLKFNYKALRKTNFDSTLDLYFNTDNRDGMEMSIGGSLGGSERGYRPTFNSYQYGEAIALSKMALYLGMKDESVSFMKLAQDLQFNLITKLWDPVAQFFKVLPKKKGATLVKVRELHGYTPWYFKAVNSTFISAWKHLLDNKGFYAPHGLTTAEQRHPQFSIEYTNSHECLWNGPTWPYATSITLTALAIQLQRNNCKICKYVTQSDYYGILKTYAYSHFIDSNQIDLKLQTFKLIPGFTQADIEARIPWIDEDLDPFTGEWIARTVLYRWYKEGLSVKLKQKGGKDRGKHYNHSTFVDLIISGLIGLKPSASNKLNIHPLIPDGIWTYFCLDYVKYHDKIITVLWDETGLRYNRGKGFKVYVDGVLKVSKKSIRRVVVELE